MSQATFYLVSNSPRRRELLQQIQASFSVLRLDVVEPAWQNESPQDYVQALALYKARCGWNTLQPSSRLPCLGADTIVVNQGQVFGKPKDKADARSMLQQLSGRSHQVMTAVAVLDAEQTQSCLVETTVSFRELTLAEIDAYWETGEPADKAGAYAIQGYAALFVTSIQGSYSNVVGLPLVETAALLQQFDITVGLA